MSLPPVRFDDFVFDRESQELTLGGAPLRLQELPCRLLGILLEHPQHIVPREELQRRLWPDTPFLDFEDGLNTAVRKLRQALGDDPVRPRYIETVRKRGYRFAAALEVPGPEVEAPPGAPPPVGTAPLEPQARPRRNGLWWGALAMVLLVGGGFIWWWMNPLPDPAVTRIVRITDSGSIDTPWKLVTDGARIFFMQRAGGHWQLMQTSLDGGGAEPVPSPFPNMLVMDVSPSRTTLLAGSFSRRGTEMPMWRLPTQGGPPQSLAGLVGSDAAYSHDGRRIAFGHDSAIWLGHADGSDARKLVKCSGVPGAIAWSPHDRRLRFTITRPLSGASSLWEVSAKGAGLHPLLPGWSRSASECCGNWTRNGRYFVFTSGHGGSLNLWALREAGFSWRRAPRGPFQLTFGPVAAMGTMISPRGQRVYFYGGHHQEELVAWQGADTPPPPFLPALHPAEPEFAPRTGELAYLDRENRLWRSHLDGSHRRLLLDGRASRLGLTFPRWSPGGRTVAITGQVAGREGQVYLVPSRGGAPQPLAPGLHDVRDADWSPGGRRLVFAYVPHPAAEAQSHHLAIFARASGKITPLAGASGLILPRWSPAAGVIAATREDGSAMMLYNLKDQRWRVVARGRLLGMPVWSADGHYLYYQDLLAPGEPLYRLDPAQAKSTRKIADFTPLLHSGVLRCALMGLDHDGQPLMDLTLSNSDIFAADLRLP